MVARLLSGILAAVLLPLGLVFGVVGLGADGADGGGPQGFLLIGAPLAALGLACAAAFVVLTRREAARRRRRQGGTRVRAYVVEARWRPGIRVGAWLTYDLAVRFDPAGEVRQRILVMPGTPLKEGQTIEIVHDPSDPTNFELA